MDIGKPLCLKAMIALTSFVALISVLLASSDQASPLVSGIRITIFTALLIGLLLNVSFARWASVILFTIIAFGGIGSLFITFQNGNLSILIAALVILIICPTLIICYACAFSKSVSMYYRLMSEKNVKRDKLSEPK